MTLPSSGSITTAQIAAELGGYPFSIPSAAIRNLTGRAAGNITMPTDFYGQTGGGSCTELDTNSGNTISGTVTLAGVSFGATAWNRRIFLCVAYSCATSATETIVTAATIGGVSATIHVTTGEGGTSATSNYGVAIISATVPTGTTGNATITFSNSTIRSVYATGYRVTGLVSAVAHDTGAAFDETVGAGTATAQALLNVQIRGLAFFSAIGSAATSVGAMSTTGISEQQEQLANPDGRMSNGFSTGMSAQTNRPITTSCAMNPTGRLRLVVASFQLA